MKEYIGAVRDGAQPVAVQGIVAQSFGAVFDLCLAAPRPTAAAPLARADVLGDLLVQIISPPRGTAIILIRAEAGGFGLGLGPMTEALGGAEGFAALLAAVEGSAIPVAFLMADRVEGAAAELALACHLRIAGPAARFWLPAHALGRIGGAGATQRLPRVAGAEAAISLLQRAAPVSAAEALVLGAIDHVIDESDPKTLIALTRAALAKGLAKAAPEPRGKLAEAAAGMAPELPEPCAPFARTKGIAAPARFLAEVASARQAAKDDLARAVVNCVEAALLLPPAVGLAFEAAHADDLAGAPLAVTLGYISALERRALVPPSGHDVSAAPLVARVGAAGCAVWLAGPLRAILRAGMSVVVSAPDEVAAKPLLEAIARDQEQMVQARRMTAAARDADWARLSVMTGEAAMAALTECQVIISTTAQPLPAPERRRAVLHLGGGAVPDGAFQLVLRGKLAELVPPAVPRPPATVRAMQVLERIGRVVVFTADGTGFGLSKALVQAGEAAVAALIALGVPSSDVAEALAPWGLKLVVAKPDVAQPARKMSADEIRDRWLWALVNTGLAAKAQGVVDALWQVDLAAIHGLGLPRGLGGPLHQADLRGALLVRQSLRTWAKDGAVWEPHPALDDLVSAGRGFAGAPAL